MMVNGIEAVFCKITARPVPIIIPPRACQLSTRTAGQHRYCEIRCVHLFSQYTVDLQSSAVGVHALRAVTLSSMSANGASPRVPQGSDIEYCY